MHYFPIVDFMKLSLYKFSNKYFSKIGNPFSSSGFTLIELLAAISLTTIVVGAAGFGVVTIMNANAKSESKTQRRVELNRALDYIAEDIRRASDVSSVSSSSSFYGSGTGVLSLNIPYKPNLEYYVRESTSTWIGPNTINRRHSDSSNDNALVDAITEPTSEPTCSDGTLEGANGFYACIINDRTVELYLYGKLGDDSEPYQVTTKVFARSASPSSGS